VIETPEPVEPPCVDDCCSATGPARLAAELSRVIHEFAEDLPWPDSQRLGADAARAVWAAGSSAPVPASQSVPAVPVSSTGRKETGEATETATEALSADLRSIRDFIVRSVGFDGGQGMTTQAEELRDLFLDAGWRPPLPEGGEEIGDDVIVHFEGRPVVGRPLSVKVGWEGDQFVELPRDFAVPASSPLPDSETEPGSFADAFMRASADTADMDVISARMAAEGWREKRVVRVDSETERPRRCPAVTPESDLITEGRQCQQYEGHAHDHTWYGDNGAAYSAWRVTS
jgi:hypothetical protein